MGKLRHPMILSVCALTAAALGFAGQAGRSIQPVYACCPGTTVLESVSASPTSVGDGGTVVVSVHLTDAGSPVTSASICYLLPTGAEAPGCGNEPQAGMVSIPPLTLASGTAQDGIWQTSIAVPALAASGMWTVLYVTTMDGTGVNTFFAPNPAFDAGAFTVTGTNDYTPPAISDVTGPASPVPLGSTFAISSRITDASGVAVAAFAICLNGPPGCFQQPASLVSGSPQDGIWQVSLVASFPGDVLLVLAQDLAGNGDWLSGSPLLTFDVTTADVTPPVITIVSPAPGNYFLNQQVLANYSCSDPDSSVSTCTGPVASGSAIDTLSVGTKTFTVTASDPAGNTSSKSVNYTVSYNVCALNDQSRAVSSGSTVPIKLELCDASGNDVSSSSATVTVTGLTNLSTDTALAARASGNANPGNSFRFDPTLGTNGGYIFNLSTVGLPPGTYALSFTVTNDPIGHMVQFNID